MDINRHCTTALQNKTELTEKYMKKTQNYGKTFFVANKSEKTYVEFYYNENTKDFCVYHILGVLMFLDKHMTCIFYELSL